MDLRGGTKEIFEHRKLNKDISKKCTRAKSNWQKNVRILKSLNPNTTIEKTTQQNKTNDDVVEKRKGTVQSLCVEGKDEKYYAGTIGKLKKSGRVIFLFLKTI